MVEEKVTTDNTLPPKSHPSEVTSRESGQEGEGARDMLRCLGVLAAPPRRGWFTARSPPPPPAPPPARPGLRLRRPRLREHPRQSVRLGGCPAHRVQPLDPGLPTPGRHLRFGPLGHHPGTGPEPQLLPASRPRHLPAVPRRLRPEALGLSPADARGACDRLRTRLPGGVALL